MHGALSYIAETCPKLVNDLPLESNCPQATPKFTPFEADKSEVYSHSEPGTRLRID